MLKVKVIKDIHEGTRTRVKSVSKETEYYIRKT